MSEQQTVNEIKATYKKDDVDKQAVILYDFGATVEEAIEKFGAEVVLSNFKRAAVITAQAAMRRYLQQGLTEAEIQAKMDNWKPGVALERSVNPVAAILSGFDKLSDEEKAKIIEQLSAQL